MAGVFMLNYGFHRLKWQNLFVFEQQNQLLIVYNPIQNLLVGI